MGDNRYFPNSYLGDYWDNSGKGVKMEFVVVCIPTKENPHKWPSFVIKAQLLETAIFFAGLEVKRRKYGKVKVAILHKQQYLEIMSK